MWKKSLGRRKFFLSRKIIIFWKWYRIYALTIFYEKFCFLFVCVDQFWFEVREMLCIRIQNLPSTSHSTDKFVYKPRHERIIIGMLFKFEKPEVRRSLGFCICRATQFVNETAIHRPSVYIYTYKIYRKHKIFFQSLFALVKCWRLMTISDGRIFIQRFYYRCFFTSRK